jgi:dTDP-4-dehydrorhamnose reductase
MKKITIVVTGSNGQVGQELQAIANQYIDFEFVFTDRKTLDIGNSESVEKYFQSTDCQYVINAAAYTAVDKAETETELAANINTTGATYLAAICAIKNIKLVHISTDYVYDKLNAPICENAPTNPKGVYAQTKFMGDEAVLNTPNLIAAVVRTSWVYSSFGHNFLKTMLKYGAERDEMSVVFDQVGTPTYARHLAKAIVSMIQCLENSRVSVADFKGVFHYSNEGVCSWYDFAKIIFEKNNYTTRLKPIRSVAFPTPAERPSYSVLDKSKIKNTFGIEIPYWTDALDECLLNAVFSIRTI